MKILREPLLHFLVIGALLFGVFSWVSADDKSAPGEIVVTTAQIANLEAIFSRTWQRPPSAQELDGLVADHVRDEILYREAVAMGLDRDDAVIRRRIRQKMEFVADMIADAEPTDAELKTFVADHPAWFRAEPLFSFSQVYFQASPEGGLSNAMLKQLVQALNDGTANASQAGDPFLAGSDFRGLSRSEVAQAFGENFAAWMDRSGSDQWGGPVTSAYGVHLVRVSERIDARELPFEEVRAAARREWLHARKVAANDALYEKLRSRYVIEVENVAVQPGGDKLAEAAP